ncbi:MAG: TonB-dependent receptor [Proteobacteria bacterium]|nr:TonB-dependent receptor [Pseudomonadota bacterium]
MPETRGYGLAAILTAALGGSFWGTPALAQQQVAAADFSKLSIEQLGNVEITSVSKRAQPLSGAPAAIYVITHDDIMRSGAASIPEMLRLAPNLHVAQTSPANYVITARGFSGNSAAQNFSDKLLVLIDGRSVYNPLFSGMYWDMQDVLPENIERIEVISGPGATLWSANAVNGVINIVTRKSADTQGGVLEFGAGNQYESASLQYGGALSDDLTYRAYIKTFRDKSFEASGHDGWYKPQGGFRLDWTPGNDTLTVQGDVYDGRENNGAEADGLISGGNLSANWAHNFADGSSLQVLAYYDNVERSTTGGSAGFTVDTYNVDAQYNFMWGSWNNLVVGAGQRLSHYSIIDRIGPATSLLFIPNRGDLNLSDIFIQDQMSLSDGFDLTLGLKLENDPYSGITPMPSARASWRMDEGNTLWAAVSRAIRSPTPFDTHVGEDLGTTRFLNGNPDFLPEKLTAYELGYRGQLSEDVSLSVSAFDDEYDDLKSIELDRTSGFLPLHWGNGMKGRVYGAEAWATYEVSDWWKLSAGANIQSESFRFKPGASGLLGLSQQGNDPHHQASLRSSMNLSDSVTFDADLRYAGQLPDPHVPSYVELNARLGWMITDKIELSLSGYNLLHDQHREFSLGDEIKRSFFVDTRWKF